MNEISGFGNERYVKNMPSTPESSEKKQSNDYALPSASSQPNHERSTVSISAEARLLSNASDGPATTSKGNVLPDYLQPPPEGYTPNPSASSGNTFHFLTNNDRDTIYAAFDYAIENGLDTEEVGLAAFFLANQRHAESLVASGVRYVVYDPELHGGNVISETGNTSTLNKSRAELTEKALSGELFNDNPVLNQTLFIKALFNALRLSDAAIEERIVNSIPLSSDVVDS